ncbi:LOW QUALITY PROTEIN: probable RNA polymerase II nuclear localization protein SLC7A6OS [Drosophila ficusphila]|uniref:LOW QUALITY PROTEIN: probable RNA polymerase II nuclear localization protein SLC7A6OS n=1 Tax=Drosophila ficusphila TaxID=30025 RepID=UPI001C8A93C9|nr:LOW QUALITY PROTEIN: probable RNA polymerase II nuclear localization protein SLC7A6OS [Drosophila ficusphila]
MPAVVRIKRRIDEEPHTAFVLNGKRRRLHNDENSLEDSGAVAGASASDKDELTTVLKFAGTLENQDDCATRQFAAARLNKTTARELVQQQRSNDAAIASALRRDRQRQEAQQNAREQRFRVVNCLRSTLEDNATEAESSENQNQEARSHITIVDIESQQQQQQSGAQNPDNQDPQQLIEPNHDQQQPADSDVGYVYDLYVPENEMQAAYVDMMDDNYLRVIPVGEIVLEDCYNDQDEDYDSEDSNQENYFTNDYPDDEEAEGMGSDDELARQMNKFMLDDDEDDYPSTSDDEDYAKYHDPYVHTIDTEQDSFVDDVDFYNVDRERGSAYERYKRRVLKELEEGHEDDDEDSFASADEE